MKTTNEFEKNVYVQPVCKVIDIDLQQMIAASTSSEAYRDGDTNDWFNN